MEEIEINRRVFTLFVLLSLIFTSFYSLAISDQGQIPERDIEREKHLTHNRGNEIIIKFKKDHKSSSSIRSMSTFSNPDHNSKEIDSLTRLVHVEDSNVDNVIKQLENSPEIEYAEKNYLYRQTSLPNDPYYNNLWHLENIKAESAWTKINQDHKPIVVSVIDSGIDIHHPDLKNRIAPGGYNFLHDSRDIYDYDGHGTFISGIIAAEANNNYGITGLAGESNIQILPLTVSNYDGVSSVYDIVRAIDYSISRNVHVINLSLGDPDYSHAFKDAIQRAIAANIIVVASSGNEGLHGNEIYYPASYREVISVGATDRNNKRADFSTYNHFLDLVAPGDYIYSTYPYSDFAHGSGTSYATPMVSATAALLRSLQPDLSVDEIREILTTTAEDLGEMGKDPYYGYGLLNMEEAIKSIWEAPDILEEYKDYQYINGDNSKIFRVEFNYDLDIDSLDNNIFISTDPNGETNKLNYHLKLDPNNKNIVYVIPLTTWEKGYNYLFINDKVISLNGKQHKEKLRTTIFIE